MFVSTHITTFVLKAQVCANSKTRSLIDLLTDLSKLLSCLLLMLYSEKVLELLSF